MATGLQHLEQTRINYISNHGRNTLAKISIALEVAGFMVVASWVFLEEVAACVLENMND